MDSLGQIILYFVVAIAIVAFSYLAVTTRRILRGATYLLFVLICTAIFYFQLGYQFLGAVQIAVYAGGVMVLFVFAILLTTKPADKSDNLDSHKRVAGVIASVVGAAVLLWAVLNLPISPDATLSNLLCGDVAMPDMKQIGTAMLGTEKFQYLLPFEAVSVLLLACIIGGVTVARKR
jgi:NADH-quinone oxidoreductase subunit J